MPALKENSADNDASQPCDIQEIIEWLDKNLVKMKAKDDLIKDLGEELKKRAEEALALHDEVKSDKNHSVLIRIVHVFVFYITKAKRKNRVFLQKSGRVFFLVHPAEKIIKFLSFQNHVA